VSLINTVKSITNVDLDDFSPFPMIDGKGSHGGYCGPAVKPIALNMVGEIARHHETRGLPISGIGGVTTWRDAAEFMAMGAGNVQVCTAAMTYGFKIVEEMISGLSQYLDEKAMTQTQLVGRAVPNFVEWQDLNLNFVTKAKIDQDLCISCGRCFAACEDTSHQAIDMSAERVFTVKDDECVACNLCINVCPVQGCITMERVEPGKVDARTGKVVPAEHGDWTTHPNNPMRVAAE
jgi:dihydropyrimidine dehydrogenase (NAD+) subunit PreA